MDDIAVGIALPILNGDPVPARSFVHPRRSVRIFGIELVVIVAVERPVDARVPPPVLRFDGRRGKHHFRAAAQQLLLRIDLLVREARSVADRAVLHEIVAQSLVIGYVGTQAVAEENTRNAHFVGVLGLGIDRAADLVGIVRPGHAAPAVGRDRVAAVYVIHAEVHLGAGPRSAHLQQIDAAHLRKRLRKDEAAGHRRIEIGPRLGRKRRRPVVTGRHVDIGHALPRKSRLAVERHRAAARHRARGQGRIDRRFERIIAGDRKPALRIAAQRVPTAVEGIHTGHDVQSEAAPGLVRSEHHVLIDAESRALLNLIIAFLVALARTGSGRRTPRLAPLLTAVLGVYAVRADSLSHDVRSYPSVR